MATYLERDGSSEERLPQQLTLPEVGGRTCSMSTSDLERACLVHLMEEQSNLLPNNALINTLCESVRLAREYGDTMNFKGKRDIEDLAARIYARKNWHNLTAEEVELTDALASAGRLTPSKDGFVGNYIRR